MESVHRGAVVAVDATGHILTSCGDPGLRSFARSSIKPLQALPLSADGGLERFGLTAAELAVICGSHSGEPFHVEAVRGPYALPPTHGRRHAPARRGPAGGARQLLRQTRRDAGLARLYGWDPEGYPDPGHPVQRRIAEALAAAMGSPAAATLAVDGCGVPTYHISLLELATAFARLAAPERMPEPWRAAAPLVTSAMISHPEMVAGTGRANTEVMRAAGGRVFIKDGDEAVTIVGVPERGIGVAAKIEDGGARALPAVTLAALRQLNVLGEKDLAALSPHARPIVCNRKGLAVGEIRATFVLR